MRTLLSSFLAAVILAAVAPLLQAQADASREVIEEKTRFTRAEIEAALRARAANAAGAPALARSSVTSGAAPGTRETVVSGDDATESEVHAAINPTDSSNILISPIRIGSAIEGLFCPVYYTTDFGASWKKSTFQTLPKGLSVVVNGGGDPNLIFDESGRAYLTWIALYSVGNINFYGLYWAYSDDHGITWQQSDSDAVALTQYASSSGNPEIYDKEWFAVDRSTSARRNTVYMAFLQSGGSFGASRIVVRRKDPGTMHFTSPSVTISDGSFGLVQFASIDVDAESQVHVTFFGANTSGSTNSMWHSVSVDGGATFSKPVKISDLHHPRFSRDATYNSIPGISSRRIYPCPQFAIDRSNGATRGNLYSVWSADGITRDLGNGLDVYFSRSTDHGATWSVPLIVNDDPRGLFRHQHYPSIAVNHDGVIVVSYYDRRNDPANNTTVYSVAYSFDGGTSFMKTIPAAATPTNFSTVGLQNNTFGIGEYTQVLTTSGYAIPVWTDGRTNDGDLNIYAAFVPLTRDASSVERMVDVEGNVRLVVPPIADNRLRVGFNLARAMQVKVSLFDGVGHQVAVLADGSYAAGMQWTSYDASALPSGRYYVHLDGDAGRATQQVNVVR